MEVPILCILFWFLETVFMICYELRYDSDSGVSSEGLRTTD